MSDPTPFNYNGYTIEVPPAGKFNNTVPGLGNMWPSAAGKQIVSSYLAYDFAVPAVSPRQMISDYTFVEQQGPGHMQGTFRKDAVAPKEMTLSIVREVIMTYRWKAVLIELNTAGGYSQEKTFVTGVQNSTEVTETFGRVLGAEVGTKIPLLSGIDVKLTAAYNKGRNTQNKTLLTTSSTTTQTIKAPAQQVLIQWQLFIEHTITSPDITGNNVDPGHFKAYFDAYYAQITPERYPAVSIDDAPLLPDGEGIFSATMYPAT